MANYDDDDQESEDKTTPFIRGRTPAAPKPRGPAARPAPAAYGFGAASAAPSGGMFGNFKAKMRGLQHLYVQYFGNIPQKPELYEPYNNRQCLHCHSGARTFEEGATHTAEDGRIDLIKSNQLSCRSSGC